MGSKLNRASWSGFDLVFKPWMRRRMRVCIAGLPANLAADRPVMVVSNHVSWWDGFLLREIQKAIRPLSPLYTVALDRSLALHPILRLVGGIGLTPTAPGSIRRALRVLKRNCADFPDSVVGYFPQGSIAPSFRRPLGFARGVELFIKELAPLTVLPVAIHIEPLVSAAPTAFVFVGKPRSSDAVSIDASSLEADVTRLLDASLATLASQGEDSATEWRDALADNHCDNRDDRQEFVVLVDRDDAATGVAEKLHAHRSGALHRAFSVVVFNARGELLLQRRASSKYHSSGLWSNTCCGHPRPGEDTIAAARRRLGEELGIDCDLTPAADFLYRAELDTELVEHEYDHVLVGVYDGDPAPDPREVMSWRWAEPDAIALQLATAPECYTAWFPLVLQSLKVPTVAAQEHLPVLLGQESDPGESVLSRGPETRT